VPARSSAQLAAGRAAATQALGRSASISPAEWSEVDWFGFAGGVGEGAKRLDPARDGSAWPLTGGARYGPAYAGSMSIPDDPDRDELEAALAEAVANAAV
jgi:hypothetical protein